MIISYEVIRIKSNVISDIVSINVLSDICTILTGYGWTVDIKKN